MTQPPTDPTLPAVGPPGWGSNPYGPVRTVAADPSKLNSAALWGFVSSLLGCVPAFAVAGIVAGVAALRQIRRAPQRGRGLAWSAILVSCFWLAAAAALLGPVIFEPPVSGQAERNPNGEIVKPGLVHLVELRPGDCADNYLPDAAVVTGVPCSTPHHIEVIGRFALHATDIRSPAAETEAMDRCRGVLSVYAPAGTGHPNREVEFAPHAANRPNALVVCWVNDSYHTYTGSIRA